MPLLCLWINIMYGVLKSSVNTGADDELASVFSTPLSINSNQPEFSSDTLSLNRVVSSQGVQRWEIEAEIMPVDNTAEHLLMSVLNGGHSAIYVRMPQPYTKVKQEYTVPMLSVANQSSGSTSLTVSGVRPILGHFIRFTAHTKVYIVAGVVDNGDNYDIMVYPKLAKPVAINEVVQYASRVTAKMKYDSNVVRGIKYSDGVLSSPGSITLIEDLR